MEQIESNLLKESKNKITKVPNFKISTQLYSIKKFIKNKKTFNINSMCKLITNNISKFFEIANYSIMSYDLNVFNKWYDSLVLICKNDKTIASTLEKGTNAILEQLYFGMKNIDRITANYHNGYTECLIILIKMFNKMLSLTYFNSLLDTLFKLIHFNHKNKNDEIINLFGNEKIWTRNKNKLTNNEMDITWSLSLSIYALKDELGGLLDDETETIMTENLTKLKSDLDDSLDRSKTEKLLFELPYFVLMVTTLINLNDAAHINFYIPFIIKLLNCRTLTNYAINCFLVRDQINNIINALIMQDENMFTYQSGIIKKDNLLTLFSQEPEVYCPYENCRDVITLRKLLWVFINNYYDVFDIVTKMNNKEIASDDDNIITTINCFNDLFKNLLFHANKYCDFNEFYLVDTEDHECFLIEFFKYAILFDNFQYVIFFKKNATDDIKKTLIQTKMKLCSSRNSTKVDSVSYLDMLLEYPIKIKREDKILNKFYPHIYKHAPFSDVMTRKILDCLINSKSRKYLTNKMMNKYLKKFKTCNQNGIMHLLKKYVNNCDDIIEFSKYVAQGRFDWTIPRNYNYSSDEGPTISVKLDTEGKIIEPIKILKKVVCVANSCQMLYFKNENTSGSGFRTGIIQQLLDYTINKLTDNNTGKFNYDLTNNYTMMKYYGSLVGLCICQRISINIPNELIKFAITKKLSLEDVIDEKTIQNINSLETLSANILNEMELTSLIPVTSNGRITYNLFNCQTDYNTRIDSTNIDRYIQCLKDYYVCKYEDSPRYKNFNKFKEGFLNIFTKKSALKDNLSFILFLALVRNYRGIITSKNIEKHLSFQGGNEKSKPYFLKYLKGLSETNFAKFIEFATGSKQLYCHNQGSKQRMDIRFTALSDKLPISSTCNKMVQIPSYESYKIFKNKMDLAISHHNTFQNA
jgi:hypothetical protein